MARKPSWALGSKDDIPAPRNLNFQARLCDAVKNRLLVRIRYKDDHAERLIAPYGVYRSTKDKYLLASTQIDNPEKPLDRWEPRNLEVGLMTSVVVTDTKFQPDVRFDPFDARYSNGFVCRI
ncbi:MAG: hypothetical protein CTY31_05030 [Hyphomicrobium sp.]|nr:MAG: hypothetical protein CTY31_05030 [Hyphomicrobium sp.]